MKRVLALVLALCLCMCLAGCDSWDYVKAAKLYEDGEYAEALSIFRELEDYADSAVMAEICQQIVDYAQAEALYEAGDYRGALELYQAHERYEDSAAKSLRCRYAIGLGCIESGDYEEATTWLDGLGGYEHSHANAEKARFLWLHTYIQENGPVKLELESESTAFLQLDANADGSLTLTYCKEGMLLGMPFSDKMELTLVQGQKTADYTALCVSTALNEIKEEAAGAVGLVGYTVGAATGMGTFTHTVTDPEGVQTVSTNTADALMVTTMFLTVQTVITEKLPAMLAQTGVDITVQDLGFYAFS